MAARALFAGPGALRALRHRHRSGAVELVLTHGCYARFDDDWLLLAGPETPFGPLSLALVGLDLRALRPGLPARVESGRLFAGENTVSLERMCERRPSAGTRTGGAGERPGGATAALGTRGGRSCAAAAVLRVIGPPPAGLAPGLVALRKGRIYEGVRRLAGLGGGLTPTGDDALAGYAAWRHSTGARARMSAPAEGRSSPLGLAYLRCAERGELPDAGATLLAALRTGDPHAATAAVRALRGWGASSGAALAWGLVTGAAAQPERASLTRPPENLSPQMRISGDRSLRGRVMDAGAG
jgi:Protein of unknown function (DUF2877)